MVASSSLANVNSSDLVFGPENTFAEMIWCLNHNFAYVHLECNLSVPKQNKKNYAHTYNSR